MSHKDLSISRYLHGLMVDLIVKYYIGNPDYKYLIAKRFPDLGSIFSESVNQITAYLALPIIPIAPQYVFIELTNKCNLKCVMCPVHDNSKFMRERGNFTLEMVKKLVINNPSLKVVYLTNWGEPLLNKEVVEIVRYLNSKGIVTVLTTNATLLDASLAKEIMDAGVSVLRFSVDAIGDIFEKIRKCSYDIVRENIMNCVDIRSNGSYETSIEINTTYMPGTEEEAKKVSDAWGDIVDYIHFQGVVDFSSKEVRTTRCRQLYRSLFVLVDGSVVPCCADYNAELSFGNISKEPNIKKLLNNEKMRDLRRAHRKGSLEGICKHCTQYNDETIMGRRQSSLI